LRDWKHLKPDTVKVIPDAEQATFVVPEAPPLPVLDDERAKTVLRQVWQAARVDPPKFARLAYSQLFWENGEIAALFRGTAMETQGQRLVDMVGQAIGLLDDRDTLSSALKTLGAMHVQKGVLEEHFPAVGRAVRWAMKTSTGDVRWSPEADAAWHWFYDIVSTGMIEGARSEAR
jgi:hemoglobin-like flavoprotein